MHLGYCIAYIDHLHHPLDGTGPADNPPVPNFADMQLQNYIAGQWIAGSGKQAELIDASTGELIATTSSTGLDFAAMLHYARTVGGPLQCHSPQMSQQAHAC